MKITKNLLDPQLKSRYWFITLISYFGEHIWWTRLMNFLLSALKGSKIKGLHCQQCSIPSKSGGPDIRILIIKATHQSGKLPCMLHLHAGGFMTGIPEISFPEIKKIIEARACVVVAPDYRKSINHPFPAAFNDCYDTLLWIKENAASLGVLDDNFILHGESAGGGLAAAIAIKARDTKDLTVAFQMPLYPMIDDRHITESSNIMTLFPWNSAINKHAWKMYLKKLYDEGLPISSYASPARNEDYTGLPPVITLVGSLDPFRDETVAYVDELQKAGVPVVFKMFEGCFHGFDILVPNATVSKSAAAFKINYYKKFYDLYIVGDIKN